jgi:hypothetical protein
MAAKLSFTPDPEGIALQKVMGHSPLQVSLTYLRGLEVQQMELEDMPSL